MAEYKILDIRLINIILVCGEEIKRKEKLKDRETALI